MGIRKLISSSLVSIVYFALAYAGDEGGWESKSSCQPVTTTIYSVSTLYYEKTVWSNSIVYLTDTTTKVQVEPTTIAIPTTIVNQQTITHVDLSTLVDTVTTTVISNVAGPTTTVSACPTTPLVGLVTCTSRIVNPTYTPPHPLPSNYLWGCPPGTLCTPPQIGCNFEQNPPAKSYFCAPSECKPVPPVTVPEDFIASGPNPTEADCAWYKPNPGYFNINPELFGLSFKIFDIYGQPVCPPAPPPPPPPTTTTSGWSDWSNAQPSHTYTPRMVRSGVRSWNPLAGIAKRQDHITIGPKECWLDFDSANLIGQRVGLVRDILCPADSEFEVALAACDDCAATYSTTSFSTGSIPELQHYVGYCLTNATSAR